MSELGLVLHNSGVTVMMQFVKPVVEQRAGFVFLCFVLQTLMTWHDRIPAAVTSSYWPLGLSYKGALCFLLVWIRMSFPIITLSANVSIAALAKNICLISSKNKYYYT